MHFFVAPSQNGVMIKGINFISLIVSQNRRKSILNALYCTLGEPACQRSIYPSAFSGFGQPEALDPNKHK